MKVIENVRPVAIAALGFLGLSGIAGGIGLIAQANGEPFGLPQGLLQYSPFHSYLIPGIILFVANGLLTTESNVFSALGTAARTICAAVFFTTLNGSPFTAMSASTRCVWQSISPGRTVLSERSINFASLGRRNCLPTAVT
jgi:hypothetical protein